MIYFFYGLDTFRLKAHIDQVRADFAGSQTQADVVQINAVDLAPNQLSALLRSTSLFSQQRLVIIEDCFSAPLDIRTDLDGHLRKGLPTDVVVVLTEAALPDRRLSLCKWLLSHAAVEEFAPLPPAALVTYVTQLAAAHQVTLPPDLTDQLIYLTGPDLWRINNELIKLSAYSRTQPLAPLVLAELVSANLEDDIFGILNALGQHQLPQANRLILDLTQRGEDPISLLAVLAWQLRNLIRLSYLVRQGRSASEIARLTGLHPYAISQTLRQLSAFSPRWLVSAYQLVIRLDWRIKQGDIEGHDAVDWLVTTLAAGSTA